MFIFVIVIPVGGLIYFLYYFFTQSQRERYQQWEVIAEMDQQYKEQKIEETAQMQNGLDILIKLNTLKESGAITEEEFNLHKAKLLK